MQNQVNQLAAVPADGVAVVQKGDTVYDRHGHGFTFHYCTRPTEAGKSGKVMVTSQFDPHAHMHMPEELYAHIFSLRVVRLLRVGPACDREA